MTLQYESNDEYEEYSASKTSIGLTFSNKKGKFLPYIRQYDSLNEEKLLDLINIAKKMEWTALDLSDCGLKKIPDELWDVTSLKLLYIGCNTSSSNSKSNVYSEISEKISNLVNLEALSISYMKNIKIPKTIKKLPSLVYLDCFGCNFKTIPNSLLNKNLKAIGINCSTDSQLKQICKIKKIEEIYLTGSTLTTLPEEIGHLSCLKKLILVRSNVTNIPDSMINLHSLKIFSIWGTPLAQLIPDEIKEQTPIEVISFICKQQNEDENFYFNESKMIVVGQGNVGKSCLVERITEDKYEDRESTEGIDIKVWTYTMKKTNYNLNIWDFGGQEIYHSTHQFFLTKRSLYILVWDARAEEEYGRIDYWLKTIESFADDCPIIIAINKCDELITRVNRIDFKEYQQRYPQIKVILDISCKDNINIQRLRDLVKKEASNLPITKERWLKSWHIIRNILVQKGKIYKYISLEQYLEICVKENVARDEAMSLSKYLHDLGIILHYQKDRFLKNIVILNPEWATNALYKILDNQETILNGRNGILYLSDLPQIWSDTLIYPEDKYLFLLRIMEKFDLCYSIDDQTFLVAELLENTSIDCPKSWDLNENCICINYKYEFMPAGIMTRFIVKIHAYIARIQGINMCWKKGVYLKNKSAYASVIMKDSISEKILEVKVSKENNSVDERELLFTIRETIRSLNNSFSNIQVEEFVPCNCSHECKFMFPYRVLCEALEKKQTTIQCYNSFKHVDILNLLEGIDIMKNEEISPYSIKIENNPIITTTITTDNANNQTNTISIHEVERIIIEMQGDISELKNECESKLEGEEALDVMQQLEQINVDLDQIENCNTSKEIIKSGRLNKLKRFLINLSDENSNIRKLLLGVKNATSIIGGILTKYNLLAEKLGIPTLPVFK